MIDQRKPRRNAPCKCLKLPPECRLSESIHVSFHTYHTLFPPNMHFICFIPFSLCGNSFLQSWSTRALSLTTDIEARIWYANHHNPTSISVSTRYMPRPPEIHSTVLLVSRARFGFVIILLWFYFLLSTRLILLFS